MTKPIQFTAGEERDRMNPASIATVHERPYLPLLQTNDLVLDRRNGTVRTPEGEFHLHPRQADVLAFLMQHPGTPFRDEEILHRVWGGPAQSWGGDVVRMHIRAIRGIIGPSYVVTTRGYGYSVRE